MRIAWTVITVTAAGALLAGCGSASKPAAPAAASSAPAGNGVAALSADEILYRAKSAVNAAGSFRVKGTVTDTDGPFTLDLKVQGTDVMGSVAVGPVKIEMLGVGTKRYIRPNEAFWARVAGPKKAPTIAKLMGDKWAVAPATDRDLDEFFTAATIDQLLAPDGTLSKGATTDVGGVPAIALVDSKDKGALYVATTGQPYPLRVEPKKPGDGALVFSDFGATFTDLKAPPEAKVIDFSKLTGS